IMVGTPLYMSPEQAEFYNLDIDTRTDVYSLGVILYELLCGQRPFSGSVAQVIGRIIYVEPTPPSAHHEGIDEELESIALKAMAKQKEDRFATMQEFAVALSTWVGSQPSSLDGPVATAILSQIDSATLSATHDAAPVADESPLTAGRYWTADTINRSRVREQPATRKSTFPGWRTRLLTVLVGVALLAAVIVFSIRTPTGTVRFTLTEPTADVTIAVDGSTINVTADGRPFEFSVGEHELQVTAPGFRTFTRNFTIHKGKNSVLEIALLPVDPNMKPEGSNLTRPATTGELVDVDPKTEDRDLAGHIESSLENQLSEFASRVESLKDKPASVPDVEQLRNDLGDFRLKQYGTRHAIRAAELMADFAGR
ncbi:MAG: protein kinase, partial [Planctomycetales bacterium]|nr:protein kinase [Planctomycetales bacterium]